jgi:hypothetical protein
MAVVYFVGSQLSSESAIGLCAHFNLSRSKFHATIIYSKDWFTYKDDKPYPIIVDPPFKLDIFSKQVVLILHSPEIVLRHQELRASGASWDHFNFKPHISLGKDCPMKVPPTFPLVFDKEYYGTWKE